MVTNVGSGARAPARSEYAVVTVALTGHLRDWRAAFSVESRHEQLSRAVAAGRLLAGRDDDFLIARLDDRRLLQVLDSFGALITDWSDDDHSRFAQGLSRVWSPPAADGNRTRGGGR